MRRKDALPAELKPEWLTAICDSREQRPLCLDPLKMVTGTLDVADYSLVGLEHVVRVERKSETDLIACVGRERGRFERELQRLLGFPARALVIESTWQRIELGQWRSRVTPSAAIGSLLGWSAMGIPVVMAGDHATAGRYVGRLLFIAARRRWREARTLVGNVLDRGTG